MFYEACRCGGVDETEAKLMYYAVYHFGPRWQPVTENVLRQVVAPNGQVVQQEVAVQNVARSDPPPPTPDELEQAKAYIAEDNPAQAAIERFNRDSLHRRPARSSDWASRTKAGGVPVRNRATSSMGRIRPPASHRSLSACRITAVRINQANGSQASGTRQAFRRWGRTNSSG